MDGDVAARLRRRQLFLAEPHVAALSVANDARGPLMLPIWYGYEPGGLPWIITSPASRKMAAIRAAGRFSLLVDTVGATLRYVSVEGPVTSIEPSSPAQVEDLAARYLDGAALTRYLDEAAGYGEQVTVRLEPEHWLGAEISLVH
ncbi:pyridoxamine 5'-phosphate oxidase family protein [Nocardioides ultimimeridianus]